MPLKGATISVLKSDLEAINNAIGGLYSKYPINVAGKYLAGKTLLTLQEGVYICSQLKEKGDENASVLILDSDGGGELFVANWLPIFERRYGTEVDVYVLPAWNERREEQKKLAAFNMRVFSYFGIKAKVKISVNGKAEFIPHGVETKPKIEEMIVKNGVRVVIVDSFSQIFKEPFPGNQSLGARARAEDMLYALIKETGLKHPNVFFFLNHHLSVNPNRGTLDLTGGASVIQNSKLTIALIKRGGALKNFVEVQTYRHARKEVWEHAGWLRIDPDMGFVSSSQKEIEQVLAEIRKR